MLWLLAACSALQDLLPKPMDLETLPFNGKLADKKYDKSVRKDSENKKLTQEVSYYKTEGTDEFCLNMIQGAPCLSLAVISRNDWDRSGKSAKYRLVFESSENTYDSSLEVRFLYHDNDGSVTDFTILKGGEALSCSNTNDPVENAICNLIFGQITDTLANPYGL